MAQAADEAAQRGAGEPLATGTWGSAWASQFGPLATSTRALPVRPSMWSGEGNSWIRGMFHL